MVKLRTGHANRGLFKYWYHSTMMGDMYSTKTKQLQKGNNKQKIHEKVSKKKYIRYKTSTNEKEHFVIICKHKGKNYYNKKKSKEVFTRFSKSNL